MALIPVPQAIEAKRRKKELEAIREAIRYRNIPAVAALITYETIQDFIGIIEAEEAQLNRYKLDAIRECEEETAKHQKAIKSAENMRFDRLCSASISESQLLGIRAWIKKFEDAKPEPPKYIGMNPEDCDFI